MLGEKIKKNYKSIVEKFEKKESALISLLYEIQKENNYISDGDISELSSLIDMPYSRIKSVLTFYTMFNQKKTGKYHIQVCRNLSCSMSGARNIINFIKENLKINEHEVSDDGLFSYTTVECLGACGSSPVVMINDTYYENMDEKKLRELIDKLRKE
ncbi:MAG: NAD(P)H-dependent oxidoreductase subunit E [Elusimicrobia bacterium]|nr:NAD(P)H-dependent oxidoreductase subunit E [Elusimicrobiota bacterium]